MNKRKYVKSGMYKKQQELNLRPYITKGFRGLQWLFSGVALVGLAYILVVPFPLHNPLVGIETIHAEEKPAMLIIPIDQADQTDRRIEECWAKGYTPGVMAKGFQCVAPAVEVSVK